MEPLIQLLFQPSVEDGQQGFKRSSMSYKKAGEQLGITPYAIKRAVDAWLEGGMEAVRELKWGSGHNPMKIATSTEMDWLCSKEILIVQNGLTLHEKAVIFNRTYDRELTGVDVSDLYRSRGVTQQHTVTAVGVRKLTEANMLKQISFIDDARTRVAALFQ